MGGPVQVQWSRFSDAWQKLFGIQGNTRLNVIDDVFLTLPVEDEALHLSYLRGWRPFAFTATQPAVAAQFAGVQLQAQQGNLVVVDGFTLTGTVANQEVQLGARGDRPYVTAPGQQLAFPRDSRLPVESVGGPGAFRCGLFLTPGTGAAQQLTTVGQACLRLVAGPPGFPTTPNYLPLVLAGGSQAASFLFENNVVNLGLTVAVWGRTRELTQQEG